MSTTIETWMSEARQMAAQCWCDGETKHKEMDPVLAEAVARRIAACMEAGAFHARNEAYWRASERERCAQVCEALHHNWRWDDEPDSDSGPRACAAAIRGT